MATAPAKPATKADAKPEQLAEREPDPDFREVAPRATTPILPTPTQYEADAIASTQAAGAPLPRLPWYHLWDNSPVDPQSADQTIGPPTWPAP